MKNLFFYISIFTSAMMIQSCWTSEIPPTISLTDATLSDTTYTVSPVPAADAKHVLVEESTGDRCVNCPKATTLLETMNETYNHKIDIISIHYGGGGLNLPHPEKPELDLRPDSVLGGSYIAFLGGVNAQPNASIDRINGGSSSLMQSRTAWPAAISSRLQLTTPVNLKLTATNNTTAQRLEIKAEITYTSDRTSDSHYLTIALLENKIVGVQDSESVILHDYEFNDVFRTMVTPLSGKKLDKPREAGRVYVKTFAIPYSELKSNWVMANFRFTAAIHFNSGTTKEVLQSTSVNL